MASSTPRVYLADLAAYNNGHLHGVWVDATDSTDIQAAADKLIESSPVEGAEEVVVHDYDGFGSVIASRLGETGDWDKVAEIAELIADKGLELVEAVMGQGVTGDDADSIKDYIDENYQGVYKNLEDYAYRFHEDMGDLPKDEWFANYIDWEAVGRDLELGGDVWTHEVGYGKVHVFWNH